MASKHLKDVKVTLKDIKSDLQKIKTGNQGNSILVKGNEFQYEDDEKDVCCNYEFLVLNAKCKKAVSCCQSSVCNYLMTRRVVRKTIETFSFEEEVVQKNHTFFTREARLLLLMEVKTCLDRKMIKLLTSFRHYDILAKTRSRMTLAITFSRQNDAGSRVRTKSRSRSEVVPKVSDTFFRRVFSKQRETVLFLSTNMTFTRLLESKKS